MVSGNVGLFEILLRCKYSCLEELKLHLHDNEMEHSSIVEVFRSCRSTLSRIQIERGDYEYLKQQNSNWEPQEDLNHQEVSFSLSNLHSLVLYVEDPMLSKFYLPIGYPRLEESKLSLSSTSNISRKSFHLRQWQKDSKTDPWVNDCLRWEANNGRSFRVMSQIFSSVWHWLTSLFWLFFSICQLICVRLSLSFPQVAYHFFTSSKFIRQKQKVSSNKNVFNRTMR